MGRKYFWTPGRTSPTPSRLSTSRVNGMRSATRRPEIISSSSREDMPSDAVGMICTQGSDAVDAPEQGRGVA